MIHRNVVNEFQGLLSPTLYYDNDHSEKNAFLYIFRFIWYIRQSSWPTKFTKSILKNFQGLHKTSVMWKAKRKTNYSDNSSIVKFGRHSIVSLVKKKPSKKTIFGCNRTVCNHHHTSKKDSKKKKRLFTLYGGR